MTAVASRKIQALQNSTISVDVPDELEILDGGQDVPIGKNCWRFLNQQDGDKRVVWNSGSLSEINAAKNMFENCIKQGMIPYRVGINGKASAQEMKEFDPFAEEVIFMPAKQIVGG